MEDKNVQYIIPDVNELTFKIIQEMPEDNNEAYYAMRMILEMIENMKIPIEMEDSCECCCGCEDEPSDLECDAECDVARHFEIELEADSISDLRDQLSELFEYTYSEEFQHDIRVFNFMEYNSETGITKAVPKGTE